MDKLIFGINKREYKIRVGGEREVYPALYCDICERRLVFEDIEKKEKHK